MAGDSAGLINHEVTDDQHDQKINIKSDDNSFWREGAVPSLLHPEPQETVSQVWKSPSGSNFDLNIMSNFFHIFIQNNSFQFEKGGRWSVLCGHWHAGKLVIQNNPWLTVWTPVILWNSYIKQSLFWEHLWSDALWLDVQGGLLVLHQKDQIQERPTRLWELLQCYWWYLTQLTTTMPTQLVYLIWFISDIYQQVFC